MLNLLKIKKKKNVIDVMTLMLLSQKYLNEMKETANLTANLAALVDDNVKNIESEIKRLESLNLYNSKNYTLLNDKLKAIKKEKQLKEQAKSNIELIKLIHNEFPNSIIIGVQAFEDLLNKYNLVFGELSNYTGTIPESNIQEISLCKDKLPKFIKEIDFVNPSVYAYKVFEINTSSDKVIDNITKLLNKTNNVIFSQEKFSDRELNDYDKHFHFVYGIKNYCYYNTRTHTFEKNDGSGKITIYCNEIEESNLYIACPKEQLNKQPLKFAVKPIDPIVFNIIKGVIVIQSIWGEESEDQIIKNYIEYNKFIDML